MTFPPISRRAIMLLSLPLLLTACDNVIRTSWVPVKPQPLLLRPFAAADHPVAFYQGIPVAQGHLKWMKADRAPVAISAATGLLEGFAAPASFWPDGSVQWLRVEGVASKGVSDTQPIEVELKGSLPGRSPGAGTSVEADNAGQIIWQPAAGGRYTFTPSASLLPVRKPKAEPLTDPDFLDREGQFAWAVPRAELTETDPPIALELKLLKHRVEEENALYTVVVFQGNGGDHAPGSELEWQLRVKAYHAIPLIRTEMTWVAQWDPTRDALASAKWTVTQDAPWSAFSSPGGETTGARLLIQNDPRGAGGRSNGETAATLEESPALSREGIVASPAEGAHLAVGLHNFSRLGPNHLYGEGNRLEVAAWSERSGRVLDLRRSTSRMDYGTNDVDLKWNGRGVARTVYATFALGDNAAAAQAMTRHEASRDYLWFANAADLGASRALGPYSAEAIARNPEPMRGMQANLHFLRASRDHWRWNGWANFGDIRTNFARGNEAKRGLHAGHWALHGRYGWRNTSGTLSYGFMQTGMLLDDRKLILAGLDNAEHVVDVDAFHGSFFSPRKGDQGGMRRRNRDHWSGSVQAQYSPNAGLYLSQWLSGNRRIADTLDGLRGYASARKRENSVFPAQVWLFHYQQTHDPAALAEAERLITQCADWWREHSKHDIPGFGILYAGNFRRVSDGIHALVQFHQATGDQRYLDALEASARAFPLGTDDHVGMGAQLYLLAYLRSQGVADLPDYSQAPAELAKFTPAPFESPIAADYATLQNIILTQLPPTGDPAYRESASIAGRAVNLPVILEQFGK